jgi:hypothetical protein
MRDAQSPCRYAHFLAIFAELQSLCFEEAGRKGTWDELARKDSIRLRKAPGARKRPWQRRCRSGM